MGNCCYQVPKQIDSKEENLLVFLSDEKTHPKIKSIVKNDQDYQSDHAKEKNDEIVEAKHEDNIIVKPETELANATTLSGEGCKLDNKKRQQGFSISPDIFIQLKNQNVSQYYDTIEELGEGAFGKVSLIEHKSSKMIRAMKSIKKKNTKPAKEKEIFNEAYILKHLDHPNIVKLFELFQDAKYYYMITEYCSGGELFDRIQECSIFSEVEAAECLRQLLSAVLYCHQQNIMHRDLKPENILYESKDSNAQLKVIDFGVATKFEAGKNKTEKYGTPYYIAPEVIDKNYNEKCDVWSCGVILYILLSGYPPFNGSTDKDIMARVKMGRYKFYEDDWGKISPQAKDLISKMLTFSVKHRISAEEALDHEWFKMKKPELIIDRKIMSKLSNFQTQNKLRHAVMTFIATQTAAKEDKQELLETFKALDSDNNGVLTIDELVKGYQEIYGLSKEDAHQEVLKIIKNIDINFSNEIDFSEFVVAATDAEKLLSKKKLEQTFKLFDEDGDGLLTKTEIESALGGVDLSGGIWENVLKEFDTNGDGMIDFCEFIEFCSRKF